MMLADRQSAGKLLVRFLEKYRDNKQAIVLGLPRGGVVVAFEIAYALHLPLDVICPRKVGAPFNPELAIGAVTETGQGIFNHRLIKALGVSEKFLLEAIEKEKQQAQRRLSIFRKNRPPRELKDKIVILVDDGLATGATMKAAIQSVRVEGAKKIVVAVPVAPEDTLKEIQLETDEVVCLDTPPFFEAIGQFYQDFSQTEDEEVLELLSEYQ